MRDQLTLNVFVNHDKLDLQGNPISEDQGPEEISTSDNPGARISSEEEESKETAAADSSDATDTESEEGDPLQLGAAEEESK